MELRYYLSVLRRRAILLLMVVAVALAAAWFATPKTKTYSAQTVIYVGASSFAVSGTEQYRYDPTQLVERLITTYADMLHSPPVAESALFLTGVPRSTSQVLAESDISPRKDTQLLDVRVRDHDPQVAQKLATGIADAFNLKVHQIAGTRGEGSLPSVPAYIFQRAELPKNADSNGLIRNLALAGFFGLLVGIGLVLLFDHLDVTVKSLREIESRLQLPALAFIPFNSLHASGVLTPVGLIRPGWNETRTRDGFGSRGQGGV